MYPYGMDQIPYSVILISHQRMTKAKIYTWKFTDKSMTEPTITDVHLTGIGVTDVWFHDTKFSYLTFKPFFVFQLTAWEPMHILKGNINRNVTTCNGNQIHYKQLN